MSATLSISPTPVQVVIGASFNFRGQIRDSETRMPYDLTGGTVVSKLVSQTGGAARTIAGAGALESAPNGTLTQAVGTADTAALTPGRWFLQVQVTGTTAFGTVAPQLVPFDAVRAQ